MSSIGGIIPCFSLKSRCFRTKCDLIHDENDEFNQILIPFGVTLRDNVQNEQAIRCL